MKIIYIALLSTLIFSSCNTPQKQNTNKKYGTLVGTIIDTENLPIAARVYAIGKDDSIYMAEKCIPYERRWFSSGFTGRQFTTIGNTFKVNLPDGEATIIIKRGKEYIPLKKKIKIKAGKTHKVKFKLKRWINMASRGWYSGDDHVHRDLDEIADLLLAEDLNVAIVQAFWNDFPRDRSGDAEKTSELKRRYRQKLDKLLKKANESGVIRVDETHLFNFLSHEIEDCPGAGAVFLHVVDKSIKPYREIEQYRYSPHYVSLMENSHRDGGYTEIEKPWWFEAPIHAALGDPDLIGIANNHQHDEKYIEEIAWMRSDFKENYPDGELGYTLYNFDFYYAYLNCGFRIMPSAGTASGVMPCPVGYNRVYARVEGELTYKKWLESIKAGRSFVTNGPMLILTGNGQPTGDTLEVKEDQLVKVVCHIHSLNPIDRLEIIQSGKIVKTFRNINLDNYSAIFDVSIPFQKSCWIAARCFEKRDDDNVRFAHTAPVFRKVSSKPFIYDRQAIEWFINRINILIERAEGKDSKQSEHSRFKKESDRQATIELYKKALAVYEGLLENSR